MPKVTCYVYNCDYNYDGCCDAEEIFIDDCGECCTECDVIEEVDEDDYS